jgi:hypothetical protein
MQKQANKTRNILLYLLAFLGLGAIGGGGVFIISPGGKLMGMPLSILNLVPLMLIIALVKKPQSKLAERINFFKDMHWSWSFTIYIAFILIFWIQIQMVFLSAVHWLHTFYMFFAVVIIFVALLPQVRNLYKINCNPSPIINK